MSRWENKYVIGLTGNIAVGKSVVRQMLQHLGAYTIDADGLTHQAMSPGAPAYQPIIEMFGRFIVDNEGRIDRTRLGSIAFAVPEALAQLEALVHPVVNQAIQTLISRARQRVIVVEAIKLLESDLANAVDAIWVVDASPETQIRRLTDKRRMSEDEARKRILAQRPQADKIAAADVIVMNDGNVEDTWKQVQVGWNGVRKAIGETSKLQLPQTPAVSPSAPTPPAQRPVIVQPLQTQGITTTPLSVEPAKTDTAPVAKADAGERVVDLSLVDPKTEIVVRRGMPGNAEAIANFITRTTNKPIGRMDVMLAFGQKSYHIAYGKNEQVIALIGWQVENLITRVDEFYLSVGVPYNEIIHELISAIEDASRELQSEVSFVVLPKGTEQEITQAFLKNGYQVLNLNEVKFPAWREAAHEMISDNSVQALMKQLRADRVMKPI